MAGVEKFVSSQPQYSLLWREPELKVFPLCRANGISQIVWSPLAQGVLTGKYLPGAVAPNDSRAASATMGTMFDTAFLSRPVLEAVQQVRPLAAEGWANVVPVRSCVGSPRTERGLGHHRRYPRRADRRKRCR